MRIHPADTPPKSGEICLQVLLETENLEWVWTYLPIVHITSETEGTTTYELQVPSESRQVRLLALWYLSVRPSTCIDEASTGRLYVKSDFVDSYKNLSRNSSLNRHCTHAPSDIASLSTPPMLICLKYFRAASDRWKDAANCDTFVEHYQTTMRTHSGCRLPEPCCCTISLRQLLHCLVQRYIYI